MGEARHESLTGNGNGQRAPRAHLRGGEIDSDHLARGGKTDEGRAARNGESLGQLACLRIEMGDKLRTQGQLAWRGGVRALNG